MKKWGFCFRKFAVTWFDMWAKEFGLEVLWGDKLVWTSSNWRKGN